MAVVPSSLVQEFAVVLTAATGQSSQSVVDHGAILLAHHLALVAAAPVAMPPADSPIERAAQQAGQGCVADSDDVHWGRAVHPGAIIWPTVLEVGAGATGREALRAAFIGYEAMVRLASLFPADVRGRYHVASLVGGAGAAAAASVLLSTEGAVSADALGHALSVAGGSSGAIVELSGTRRFHREHAVRTGVGAALAAQAGVVSTRFDLECGRAVYSEAALDRDALLNSGADALVRTSVRVLPTSGWFQCAYEAARTAATNTAGWIDRLVVHVPEGISARSLHGQRAALDPWNSLEAAVALGAIAGGARRTATELTPLVTVSTEGMPGTPTGATVDVTTGAGFTTATVALPLGHPDRPASVADLASIWRLTPAQAEDRLNDVRRIFELDAPLAALPVTPPPTRRRTT